VNPIATSNTNATICQGDSILIGGVFQTTAGNYTDTIVGGSSLGCDSVITTTLVVNPIATSNTNATICQGDSILIGGVFQTTAGNYTDTIIGGSSLGCDSIATINLTVTLIPVASATSNSPACLGEAINLTATTVLGATYQWSGPNGYTSSTQNPVILSSTTLDAGIYSLTVTNTGCSSTPTTVTVVVNDCTSDTTIVLDFNIPEGFSPNGDGTNDLFVIRGIDRFPANTFVIFNRWGNKIFEASPYKNEWDGKSTSGIRIGGDDLPVGTYFYLLDLGDGSEIYKGTIYLNK
jgi:gliding motility-associated-like protein